MTDLCVPCGPQYGDIKVLLNGINDNMVGGDLMRDGLLMLWVCMPGHCDTQYIQVRVCMIGGNSGILEITA